MKTRKPPEEEISKPTRPTAEQIESSKNALRKICETNNDPTMQRMAQCYEHALRWATEEAADWPTPEQDCEIMAQILRQELGLAHPESE